jgi:hypothetical protein
MSKRLSALSAALGVVAISAAAIFFAPLIPLLAQQPADNAITRPDHIALFGDLGTCAEGDTEYNLIQHVYKRCTATNTWAAVVAVSGASANQVYMVNGSGLPALGFVGDSNSTSNTAIGASLMRLCHATYSFAVDGGAMSALTPASTCAMPANAVIIGATVNSTTAVTSAGSATLSVGTTAGSSGTSILTATAKATLSLNALVNGTVTLAAPVKLSAAGSINVTVGTATITAGVVEIYVFYYASAT